MNSLFVCADDTFEWSRSISIDFGGAAPLVETKKRHMRQFAQVETYGIRFILQASKSNRNMLIQG